mmetsp:Transcript_25051/g.51211  ORF Transcript_25051/g.51211 Transcript_25051/m.51211 type:complete len:240 (-) Transcript_25051:390-1109(-)
MVSPPTLAFTNRAESGRLVLTSSSAGRRRHRDVRPFTIGCIQKNELSAAHVTAGSSSSSSSSSFPMALMTPAASADVPVAFEPMLPETSALLAMGSVVVLCVIAGLVWANEVVPVSRTKLAISKSRGEVKEYLDELKEGATLEEDVDPPVVSAEESLDLNATDATVKLNAGDGRDFERWLFSDWLNRGGGKAGRQKEPAIPVLKDAKWNSGDNPVLVASALIGVCVLIASVTERVGGHS